MVHNYHFLINFCRESACSFPSKINLISLYEFYNQRAKTLIAFAMKYDFFVIRKRSFRDNLIVINFSDACFNVCLNILYTDESTYVD